MVSRYCAKRMRVLRSKVEGIQQSLVIDDKDKRLMDLEKSFQLQVDFRLRDVPLKAYIDWSADDTWLKTR